jgi:hypothetical protein
MDEVIDLSTNKKIQQLLKTTGFFLFKMIFRFCYLTSKNRLND